MWDLLSRFIFWFWGWTNTGDIPPDLGNCIIVYAPHTSNDDFFLGIATWRIRGYKVNILVKEEWFFFPFGPILKTLGCVPVHRGQSRNYVEQMVSQLIGDEERRILVCPEGTRKAAKFWKTGFYHAAVKANVPMVVTFLDYKYRNACVAGVVYPTGNFDKDMEAIERMFDGVNPRHPRNFNPRIYLRSAERLDMAE